MKENAISCVVGLGNPGPKYADNRHNVGFWLVDRLAERYGGTFRSEAKFHADLAKICTPVGECWLLKPDTYMNHSGRAVGALLRFYRLSLAECLVVHDDLDLSPGVIRLKSGGGHGGHNGLRDIISVMGGKDFVRVRVGVGHPGHREQVTGHVLSRPPAVEQQLIEQGLDEVERSWEVIQMGDLEKAMRDIHSRT